MKTKEQLAASLYGFGRTAVRDGGNSLRSLAGHIVAMVNGNGEFDGPLWRAREFSDRTMTLERFEDYLLRPSREGLGIPSLLWLRRVLDAHEDLAERLAALAAVRAEIPDFDARVEAERAAADVKGVVALGERGAPDDNQHARKGVKNKPDNVRFEKKEYGNSKPYLIARLKRDAKDNPKARGLLKRLEKGELSARQAGLEMGYVKPVDSARIVEQHMERLSPAELVALYRNLGRSLPEDAYDRLEAAREAYRNLTAEEEAAFCSWQQPAA